MIVFIMLMIQSIISFSILSRSLHNDKIANDNSFHYQTFFYSYRFLRFIEKDPKRPLSPDLKAFFGDKKKDKMDADKKEFGEYLKNWGAILM
ncbi:hypothetical protein [Zymomonas sp.]|uniref:hypothetical protein n=1 Tax=Zymomonas sp. TaxID=2068624 RepID=UPI0025E5FB4D|nr:hypothetical protein [Zymomonas sp.]MCA1956192.1 hypothetical protein [Zymomonas sp.]